MRPTVLFKLRSLSARQGAFALCVVACVPSVTCRSGFEGAPAQTARDIFLAREIETIDARVPARTTLASLLRGHALPEPLVTNMVTAAQTVFDPRRLRADNPYRLVLDVDGLLREFVYEIDRNFFLRIAGSGPRSAPTFGAEVLPIEKTRQTITASGTIDRENPSLIAAVDEAGENVELAIELATIFAGDVDFESDLQPGDRFELLFEKDIRNEHDFAGYGAILAAELQNNGRRMRAFRYALPGGKPDYYDAEGRSVRRFILKSPLRFEPRVTSRFSLRRLHPVLGTFRPHYGVDYGAPAGAPVIAVAGGSIVFAGYNGGAGRMVTVRHVNGYESSYLHLSAIASGVRIGQRVSQGELIGRVGSTGLATAAHLDYRLKKNGVWVNPLKEHLKQPPGEPIPDAHRAAFIAERDRLITLTENRR